jgi:hypothetical protein
MDVYDMDGNLVQRTVKAIGAALDDNGVYVSSGRYRLILVAGLDSKGDFDPDQIDFQIFEGDKFVYAFKEDARAIQYFLNKTE